ncbi:MAG TPA: type II toxin-antitoxin system YafQ family toxin [Hyphomicrobiales bacterium]|nr:type II toxin-antitoxin system YafQ family toxin [Hyphomicrobiales bacterium]
MLIPVRSAAFKRDVRRAERRGNDMAKLRTVLALLIEGVPLPERYRDHPLKGSWAGWRDLHVGPDWLLIYRVYGTELRLARTGTHSDLFDE